MKRLLPVVLAAACALPASAQISAQVSTTVDLTVNPQTVFGGRLISLDQALSQVNRFKATLPPGGIYAQSFSREVVLSLLAQPGAAGVRIYHALYPDGTPTLVLFAYDAQGNDMQTMSANDSSPCPPCYPTGGGGAQ